MRLQSQIIGLNRTDSEIIDFTVDGRPDRASFRALRRRVEQLNPEIEKRSKKELFTDPANDVYLIVCSSARPSLTA